MPRVKISINDLKCISQADSVGKDDVYWVANLRSGPAVDQSHTGLTRISYDDAYASSMPEMLRIGSGETRRFNNSVVFEKDVPANGFVFGTVHFLERDTQLTNYVAKIFEILGLILGGLALAALIGFGVGYWMGGMALAFAWALLAVIVVGTVGFFVGAMVALMRPAESDAHLGGMRIIVGPIASPPPASDKETWKLTLIPSGKLEVLDQHGAELVIYGSSHTHHAVKSGHKYETAVQLDISGGHR